MEKKRFYLLDNIKAFMIFFVVLGHLLETQTGNSYIKSLYLIIYSFHMPMFAYCSGYFAKYDPGKIKANLLYPYVIFQFLYIAFDKFILHKEVSFQLTNPTWLMWYLLAMTFWKIIIPFVDYPKDSDKFKVIIFSFLLSIVVGFDNTVRYYICLSRTIVFFPFFIIAYYQRQIMNEANFLAIRKNKIFRISVFIMGLLMCVFIFLNCENLQKAWFQGSYSYEAGDYNAFERMGIYLFSVIGILFFIAFMSEKRIRLVTRIGENSIYIYLLHGFVLKIFEKFNVGIKSIHINVIVALVLCIVFSSKYVKKAFDPLIRWNGKNKLLLRK